MERDSCNRFVAETAKLSMPVAVPASQQGSLNLRFTALEGGCSRIRPLVLRVQRLHERDRQTGACAPLHHARHEGMTRIRQMAAVVAIIMATSGAASADPSDPDLIFRKSTTFKLLTPNDKLAVYGIDDPLIDGVACHYTTPEKGGLSGALGLAEQTSDISLSCRQYGPIKFKGTFAQGDVVFGERRSILFKKMQIVRGCDTKRNILVYMTYSDKLVEGSPKNSTSTVPIQPWGAEANDTQKCADFVR
jgi:CreA protein